MKKDLKYETPEVEIIEVEVERGFDASQAGGGAGGFLPDTDEDDGPMPSIW